MIMKNDLGWCRTSRLSLGLAGSIALATAAGCGNEEEPWVATSSPAVEHHAGAVTLGQARTHGQAFILGGRLTLSWIDNFQPQSGYTGPTHLWNVQLNDATGALLTAPRMLINDANSQTYPRVAVRTGMQGGTQALVAYEDAAPGSTGPNSLKALFLDSNGAATGSALVLDTNTGAGDHFPRTIFDPWSGRYLVAFQNDRNRGVQVGQDGSKTNVYSMNVPGHATGTDIDVIPAQGTVGVVQLGNAASQFLSSVVLPSTTYSRTISGNGAGRLATKLMYDAWTDKLAVLGITYSAPTVYAAYLQTMPYNQCTSTSSCPQTSALAGVSSSTVGQSAPYAAQRDARAFASAAVNGRFLVAVRGLAENLVSGPPPQGATMEIRSFDTDGVQRNKTYAGSSCGIREMMGIGNGPTATWLFWSCANGEIRGFKITPLGAVISGEQIIVP
jgi:hypothetical protein